MNVPAIPTLPVFRDSLPARAGVSCSRAIADLRRWNRSVTALAGIDLDLFAGELIVLLGASGSGKSTLLNQLGGLDSPTAGTLLYRGADLAAFDETALDQFRRDAVGFVFQAYNLIPSLTARENVALITEICR